MRILFALDNFDHKTGGAEKAMSALAAELASRGDTVSALQRGDTEARYEWRGVAVTSAALPKKRGWSDRDLDTLRDNRMWDGIVAGAIRSLTPDVVVTQHWLSPATVRAANDAGVPAVSFLHAYGPFCAIQFRSRDALAHCDRKCFRCLPFRYKLKYPFVRRVLRLYEDALRASRLIVSNSRYMQKVLEKFYGLPSEVLYPIVDLKPCPADDGPHDRILFVKPQYVKGLPILLKVARIMREERFIVVGKARRHLQRQFARLGNVECLGWTESMRSVYARASVLFAPSLWPEPFGRVFVEAGMAGVPSVTSNAGGAPEAVGAGGILVGDILNEQAWVEALRLGMDPELRGRLSAAAQANAERLAAMDHGGLFKKMLEEALTKKAPV